MRRPGFSLVELVVSMVLLSVVAITIGGATVRVAAAGARSTQTLTALDLAADRISVIQADPGYPVLETRYAGTETVIPGYTGFTRVTTITRVLTVFQNGRSLDFKRIVVTVTAPGATEQIRRSVTIGAP